MSSLQSDLDDARMAIIKEVQISEGRIFERLSLHQTHLDRIQRALPSLRDEIYQKKVEQQAQREPREFDYENRQ